MSESIYYAIQQGDEVEVRQHLQTGHAVNIRDSLRETPLHVAAKAGQTDVVNLLIQSGADVDAQNELLWTPLHKATFGESHEVVKTLIDAGALLSIKNKIGKSAKDYAHIQSRKIIEEYEELCAQIDKAPKEVKSLGRKATLKYLRALKDDSAESNVIRVMLVGHYGVGKTTIAISLLDKPVKHLDSTDGIEVYINQCLYDSENGTWHNRGQSDQVMFRLRNFIRLDITDFAGQLIYYTTHQTYLTCRGLYLLVFNLAMGLDGQVNDEHLYPGSNELQSVIDFLEYWIAMIVTYARGEEANFPKIVLIGTHLDEIKEEKLEMIKATVRRKFNDYIISSQLVVDDNLFINAKEMDAGTKKAIRNVILQEGMKYKEFGEQIPSSWIALQRKLMDLKKRNQYFVDFDVIQEINSTLEIPLDTDGLKLYLRYLHNMGYILYFNIPVLKEQIILDPKIVIDAMRCLITCKRFIFSLWMKSSLDVMRQSGKVQKLHILKMWKEKGKQGVSQHSELLLAVMQRLDLICEPMIFNKGRRVSPEFYLVPCMMNASIPKVPIEQLQQKSRLIITFSSETILPPAIFNRLVCSCLSFWEIFESHFYNGLVVLKSGRFHVMQMKRDIKQIEVIFANMDVTKRPDVQWCLAVKLFLKATIEQIIAVYSNSLDSPITCDSSAVDALVDAKKDEIREPRTKHAEHCKCEIEYDNFKLDDISLMRIAEQLRSVDLGILCAVLLNNSRFSDQVESDNMGLQGDVKAFYVLQEWKQRARNFTVSELRNLLRTHLRDALQYENIDAPPFESAILVSNVYEEFLSIAADHVTYKYIHIGLELGFTLAEIERLKIEQKNKVLGITRSMFEKWYRNNKDDATVLKLALIFKRCGLGSLQWMTEEFEMSKTTETRQSNIARSSASRCILS
ncbi:hypothetical protein FSP39_003934 [Pinctada imbricata]|uniref:non-specific serine/threonine protein kinase n=1 Tax=Pinctada imbricata TaxID=66713 RepID=A0AA88YQH9_PINIB|nr:hypothetical protein FSP39_003934 [Pinctada imbricata]